MGLSGVFAPDFFFLCFFVFLMFELFAPRSQLCAVVGPQCQTGAVNWALQAELGRLSAVMCFITSGELTQAPRAEWSRDERYGAYNSQFLTKQSRLSWALRNWSMFCSFVISALFFWLWLRLCYLCCSPASGKFFPPPAKERIKIELSREKSCRPSEISSISRL